MVQLSVLDLANIGEGFTPADALANALDLAQHAEAAGYTRYWLAEHHNLAGIASAATAVCICHVAGGTSTIRVGARASFEKHSQILTNGSIYGSHFAFTDPSTDAIPM